MNADIMVADWGGGLTDAAAEYLKNSAFTVLVARHDGVKTPTSHDGSAFTRLTDELGLDRSKVVVAVCGSPASESGDDSDGTSSGGAEPSDPAEAARGAYDGEGAQLAHVDICDDPYAFDRGNERISISLATAFGTGVKKLADIVLGVDGDAPAGCEAADALFAEGDACETGEII
jgi:hypothetical protein